METLRFLMVSSHYPPNHLGGDAVMVQYLSEELVRRGHEVHVLHDPAVYSLVRKARPAGAPPLDGAGPVIHSPRSPSSRLGTLAHLSMDWSGKAMDETRRLVSDLKIDVLHWHNTKGFIGRPFAVPGAKALYTAHDYYLVCPRSNLARPNMSFCEHPFLCQSCLLRWKRPPQFWRVGSSRVIRPSPEVKLLSPSEFLARRLERDGLKISSVLRNFVPDVVIRSEGTHGSIVYVGMLEPHKGPRTLLEAFARCRDLQGFHLDMIGEGSLKGQLRARVTELGLADRVSVPGFLSNSEVQAKVGASTAMVVPSEWPENAPLTVLESLSKGVPVLGSDQGGLPEIIGPDSGSVVFRARATDDLARELVGFWERRGELDASRRMARSAYERRFSPAVHMKEYMHIINES